jgi:hypothetical protein
MAILVELGLNLRGKLGLSGPAQVVLVAFGGDAAGHLEEIGALGQQQGRALDLLPVLIRRGLRFDDTTRVDVDGHCLEDEVRLRIDDVLHQLLDGEERCQVCSQ